MSEITIPRGADVRPVLLAALRVNGPVEIGHADLGDAAIEDLRGELELTAVETEGGYRYEVRAAPGVALTEAQRLAEQIIRGRHCDPGAYVEERPGMEELTDAEFDALYAEVLRLLETATVTVSWEQDGEQPTTPNA